MVTKNTENILRLEKVYYIFINLNSTNNSVDFYNTKILFESILIKRDFKQCHKLLRLIHNSYFSTKKISTKFDRFLYETMRRSETFKQNLFLTFIPFSNHIATFKSKLFFNMFRFTYDKKYTTLARYLIKHDIFTDLQHVFRIPYKPNRNYNSEIYFSFIKYHLIRFFYKNYKIINGVHIKYYFNTGNYYSREIELISRTINNSIKEIDTIMRDFVISWKKINLDEYYKKADLTFGEFHVQVRLNDVYNIVMPKKLIVPFYKNVVYSYVTPEKLFFDFNIINK